MCERWVGDWTNCNILTPSSFVFSSTSFSLCWTAQSGVLRAHSPLLSAGSLYSILSPTNWTSCRTRLYHCLMPTCFLHPIQPVHSQGYILISLTGCTCSSIDGWVKGQYVTFTHSRIIPFPRLLVLCEMQTALSRIWNWVAISIFYDDNHSSLS